MSDDDVKQRINYLVEHGGLYDDPLADIRRIARWGVALGSLGLVVHVVDLLLR